MKPGTPQSLPVVGTSLFPGFRPWSGSIEMEAVYFRAALDFSIA
jgi:hypothetical protein